jgi:ribosomal protein RSM22 (predicted rRNA methylase)
MTSPNLPAELTSALEQQLEGLSRNDAARRAGVISDTYRSGGNSTSITSDIDALAYALARMPATYAAITACLNALVEIRPDFSPISLLDVGAGPGTATWAASEAFSSIEDITLLDSNAPLRDRALAFFKTSSRLADAGYLRGDARMMLDNAPAADLVIASYVINEFSNKDRLSFTEAMWSKTRDTLLIVEPGTPAGYTRIIEARAHLIATGAHVVAPCPHGNACPLTAPDWCHFSQRLQRSQAHKHLKGAELPYEDEKFSYIVVSRTPAAEHRSRVLAQPKVTKIAVTAKLCTETGLEIANVPHRDKKDYTRARKWNWGDVIFPQTNSTTE